MEPPVGPLAVLCVVALAVVAVGADTGEEACGVGGCNEKALPDTNPEGYYWRRRGGSSERITSTPHVAPSNFSGGPAWIWPNELDEQVRHSPLIDEKKNVYIQTAVRIRKFDPNGGLVWSWECRLHDGKMSMCAALYQGTLYALVSNEAQARVTMYALDMETGREKWRLGSQVHVKMDANSLLVYNDTIIMPTRHWPGHDDLDGNNQVSAFRASDGSHLWTYTAEGAVWNMMVSTPGDGTLLFATQCGAAYRLDWDGREIWKSGRSKPDAFCSCGGGTLGPNGLFYVEFSDWEASLGVVAAHRVSDGSLVWKREWDARVYGGWQYPSVGRIAPSGRLAVVAPLGGITGGPEFPGVWWLKPAWVPFHLKDLFYRRLYLGSSFVRRLMGVYPLANAVAALDAETGETIWWVDEAPWDRVAMAGDEERFIERLAKYTLDPYKKQDIMCLPDTQGIPLISGDGTVYASSSHTGDLAALRDENGDGTISLQEASVFSTGIGFLNSPSLAPGMLVAAPCWGPVYVFKDAAAR